jgi:hypothetical protein
MWQGIYKRWNPIPKLEGVRLYCAAVHDDREGFRIWLDGEPTAFLGIVVIRFENVLLYTNSDEGKRLNGIENISKVQFPHGFWKVENSSLIKEFHRQSENVYESDEIIHYAFLTCDNCIDVLSWSNPAFEYDVESLPQ